MNNRIKCTACTWHGTTEDVLDAPNPFCAKETIYGCPACKNIECFEPDNFEIRKIEDAVKITGHAFPVFEWECTHCGFLHQTEQDPSGEATCEECGLIVEIELEGSNENNM